MLPKEYFVGKTVQGMSREYQVKDYIGEGGFSFVYKGIPLSPLPDQASVIAVKVFTENTNPQQLKDFLREARRMAQLKHQHIIPLYDVSLEEVHYVPQGATQEVTEDTPLIVMGYAPQGSVRRLKPENSIIPVSPERTVGIIKQTAEALQYAHDRGIMHLDVKPENVLLGTTTQVLLSDFGNARQAGVSLQNQSLVGSPEYMAPEQFDKKPIPASDQYSLAVVTYELLTGGVPFQEPYPAIVNSHKNLLPSPFKTKLRNRITRFQEDMEEPVQKALKKEPARRYSSIAAYADDLNERYAKAKEEEDKQRKYFPQPAPQPIRPPIPVPPTPYQPQPGQQIQIPQSRPNPNILQSILQGQKINMSRRQMLIGASVIGLGLAGVGIYEGSLDPKEYEIAVGHTWHIKIDRSNFPDYFYSGRPDFSTIYLEIFGIKDTNFTAEVSDDATGSTQKVIGSIFYNTILFNTFTKFFITDRTFNTYFNDIKGVQENARGVWLHFKDVTPVTDYRDYDYHEYYAFANKNGKINGIVVFNSDWGKIPLIGIEGDFYSI